MAAESIKALKKDPRVSEEFYCSDGILLTQPLIQRCNHVFDKANYLIQGLKIGEEIYCKECCVSFQIEIDTELLDRIKKFIKSNTDIFNKKTFEEIQHLTSILRNDIGYLRVLKVVEIEKDPFALSSYGGPVLYFLDED